MAEFLGALPLFAVALTAGTFQFGLWLQKKTNSPLCNPLLISAILIICVLLLAGYPVESYREESKCLTWLLTPATVCFALPLYEQLKTLRKNLFAILTGVISGTLTSLLVIAGMCWLFHLDRQLSVTMCAWIGQSSQAA